MQIVIRADSSSRIGAGHIMRCFHLALYFRCFGHTVAFVSRDLYGNLIPFLINQEFEVIVLKNPPCSLAKVFSEYESWLGVSWQQDAEDFCFYVGYADLVIVDHYALGFEWESKIKQQLTCKLVSIDDLKRKHSCNVIIDQTLNCLPSAYHFSDCDRVLTGTSYALLNSELKNYHNLISKSFLNSQLKILITFGGSDDPNGTLRVLKSLVAANVDFKATVLLRTTAKNYDSVRSYAKKHNNYIYHIDHVDNMAEIMVHHDIAIGAAGSSCWERACIGLPSIVVPIADNQRAICEALEREEVAIKLEINQIEHELCDAIERLICKYDIYKRNGKNICDGRGIERVYENIMEIMP